MTTPPLTGQAALAQLVTVDQVDAHARRHGLDPVRSDPIVPKERGHWVDFDCPVCAAYGNQRRAEARFVPDLARLVVSCSGCNAPEQIAARLLAPVGVPAAEPAAPAEPLTFEAIEDFAAVDEPGAQALLGTDNDALIPDDGDVLAYGDGGAGKTTLIVDLAFHMAAGDEWIGIRVARPLRVLLIENEGPRAPFRAKLRRKLASWQGSPIPAGAIRVMAAPWGRLDLNDLGHRAWLAAEVRDHDADLVIAGPVTGIGMTEAGTIQQCRAFVDLVGQVRRAAERPVAFVLLHHENAAGRASGAWGGVTDTLLHVAGEGNGRTRIVVEKARWSSVYHATTVHLAWGDGETYEPVERAAVTDDDLADQIVAAIRHEPGAAWGKIEKATPGVARERRRDVRDGLLAGGLIVNVVGKAPHETIIDEVPERTSARLYAADDPYLKTLRREPGAGAAQMVLEGNPPAGTGAPGDAPEGLRRAPQLKEGAALSGAAAGRTGRAQGDALLDDSATPGQVHVPGSSPDDDAAPWWHDR